MELKLVFWFVWPPEGRLPNSANIQGGSKIKLKFGSLDSCQEDEWKCW